ncbi:MAG: DUF58 domain-containing protein [Ilumatobacter sp.]|uniref:DUF58 domain-containing protein n=1 Tax=Ilumatobacter sp. TaxID=1967498 RepID=UPI002638428D|nr:DUF58 domain-containing protein [Ilumatobacter sp.]MDJ0770226.1 DUF58 domain-containing protein [Ilumatobacter sp.]
MPTRQGWIIAAGAVAALVIGRVFAIVELFVIGAALAITVLLAVAVVRLVRPELSIVRWAHPSVLTVGDTGRVDLMIENRGSLPSPRVELTEPVGASNTAHMTVASLRPGDQVTAGYRVPASRRGVLEVGPAVVERRDLLGIASDVRLATGVTEITVAPQTYEMAMPSLGSGVLGRHLLALSQRIGPGEFHSLRDYIDGDEPRSIHWRASARSDELKVRQHEAQGVRRCIVVLDRDGDAYPAPVTDEEADVFERAVVAAGSLALSADRAGLTTRFVTGGGIDLRGPDAVAHALRVLAPIDLGPPLGDLERDAGEGLGLVIVVSSSPDTDAWRRTGRLTDPTLTRVGVFTAGAAPGPLTVDASSIDSFREGWQRLAGVRGLTRELHTSGEPV